MCVDFKAGRIVGWQPHFLGWFHERVMHQLQTHGSGSEPFTVPCHPPPPPPSLLAPMHTSGDRGQTFDRERVRVLNLNLTVVSLHRWTGSPLLYNAEDLLSHHELHHISAHHESTV